MINHNKQNLSWTIRLNQFSDMTREEVKAKHFRNYHQDDTPEDEDSIEWSLLTGSPSNDVDWNAAGAVTPAQNQRACASDWAFSATGALESWAFITNGPYDVRSFSTQQLIDCSRSFGSEGCNGGTTQQAFKYVIKNGISFQNNYPPYTARDQDCKKKDADFKINKFKKVPKNRSKALAKACDVQPISIVIDASDIYDYGAGIYANPRCFEKLDHAVLLTGYDGEVWRVKNSWGAGWGENGYIRFSRSAVPDNEGGICGILLDASYPTNE